MRTASVMKELKKIVTTISNIVCAYVSMMHGVEYNENDLNGINKVERRCNEIGVKFVLNEIVHDIGKSVFDTESKQRVRSIQLKVKL